MLDGIYRIFLVLVLFGLSIFVHELGHFLLARRLGLVVQVFSIGLGPAIWRWRRGGITYKIGLIPFGGYVSLPQLDPAGMAAIQGKAGEGGNEAPLEAEPPLPWMPPWKKVVVSVAGAAGNIVLAFILAWAVYLVGRHAGQRGIHGDLAAGPAGRGPLGGD